MNTQNKKVGKKFFILLSDLFIFKAFLNLNKKIPLLEKP